MVNYESTYITISNSFIPIIGEIFYNYHNVYAGVYLVDGAYNINVTEDVPTSIIDKLEATSLVTHHIVKYSLSELWTIKEIIFDTVLDMDGFRGMGISERDNTIKLTLGTDTSIPVAFEYYVEIGILTIDYTDGYTVFTDDEK